MCTCEHHSRRPVTASRRALLAGSTGLVTTAAVLRFDPAAAGESRTETYIGSFSGVATPDWHYLPVEVPPGVREIEVSYSYEKTDTGLGFSANVIDIGIFDPRGTDLDDGNGATGLRGWSGGARDSFRISARRATPGYLAGPITAGTWHVALGPFAVVPPGVDYEVRVTLHFGRERRRFRPQPAPRRVPGTGPGWYRGDCHLHTVHSDGRHTQASLAALAREAGLDFIGSTEHNTSSAQLTWGRHAPDDLLVVNGEEVTTRAGHWLALGLPAGTWIDWRYRPEDDALATFTERVRGVGGLAVTAHPFAPGPGSTWGFDPTYAAMDLVEIWNGPWTLDDQVAVEAWHAMLVAGTYVPVMGSSDSHTEGQVVGLPQTVVRAGTLSTPAVVQGLRGGHSWIAESSAVDLSLTASLGDRTATCGEALGASATDLVDVRLTVAGAPGCLAQLRGPVGVVGGAVTDDEGGAEVAVRVPAVLASFVRAEVRRLDGAPVLDPLAGVPGLAMVALTNPVFLGEHPRG
ncbi:CehA/McbA family metallohydrolase [Nocardioides sp.]|uniref:CehA/McbA family metallohydrolase n=1 Tax=Nocardioides sp. TaxID=35761 RepID=UPI00262FD8D8|nr:CehA/McbA family metallohydrolase [Nocardioides sp.]